MKYLILFTFSLLISSSTFSQAKMDKINELLELIDVNDMVDQMLRGNMNMVESQLAQQYTDEVKRKQVADIIIDETKSMATNLVSVDMPEIYDRLFEESDIDALITFYKTETGQKLLELTPKINEEIFSKLMTKYLPTLQSNVVNRINGLE